VYEREKFSLRGFVKSNVTGGDVGNKEHPLWRKSIIVSDKKVEKTFI
jgi:hypothetical protein